MANVADRRHVASSDEPTIGDVWAEVRAVRGLLEQLLERPAATERLATRDPAEMVMLADLAVIVGLGTFRCADAIERGRINGSFKALLRAADVENEIDLGYVLRRHRGEVIAGLRLARIGRAEEGVIWQFLPA